MHGEIVENELKENLDKGKGCIIFDFGCFFPYKDQDDLRFAFSLNNEMKNDIKLNHRYPNHQFVTITRKYGRKLSKLGYPYFVDLNKEYKILLSIKTGVCLADYIYTFPLSFLLTKEHPVCGLKLKLTHVGMMVKFSSWQKCEGGGWRENVWTNYDFDREYVIKLDDPVKKLKEENGIFKIQYTYQTILRPVPQKLEVIMI